MHSGAVFEPSGPDCQVREEHDSGNAGVLHGQSGDSDSVVAYGPIKFCFR